MKYLITATLALFLFSCGTNTTNESASNTGSASQVSEEDKATVEEKIAVCVWDQVSVRESPNSKGKWKTSISLGESLTSLGLTVIDSLDKNRKYLKVRLADDTEGWSVSDFIIEEAKVGVFLMDKDIYKRPDLLTKSDKQFSQLDIVAIKSEQGDWYEVTGKRAEGKWLDSGWVKKGDISSESIDVAVAKFARKAQEEDSEEATIEAYEEILNNGDLAGSAFISMIEEKLSELKTPQIEEVVDSEIQNATDSTTNE